MDTPAPPPDQAPITAQVTVTGAEAALLRDLAAVTGRSPQDLALQYAAGALVLPPADRAPVEWAVFDDGPADLAGRSEELLHGLGGAA